jgi:transposase InsO family protein
MSRRGNPYDNAKAESFMKTLKAEAVLLRDYETFEDVTADLPRFLARFTILGGSTSRSALSGRRGASRARLTKRPHGDVARAAKRVHPTKAICRYTRA